MRRRARCWPAASTRVSGACCEQRPAARSPGRTSGLALSVSRRLTAPAAAAVRSQDDLRSEIARAGGRVLETDPLNNSLVADVPASSLQVTEARCAHDRGRASRAPPRDRAWPCRPRLWARRRSGLAGYTGGLGANDTSPIDLAIVQRQDPAGPSGLCGHPVPDSARAWRRAPAAALATASCDHGPAVASVAISRGATGCSGCTPDDADKRGVAPASTAFSMQTRAAANAYVWALGIDVPRTARRGRPGRGHEQQRRCRRPPTTTT